MFAGLIDIVLNIAAGLGIGMAWDKIQPNVAPTAPTTGFGFNLKTVVILVACVAGGFLLSFLGKTLGIKLFKRR
jgi:hypothetical protein